jgi:protocatechuate 3,4-dioxygenase beta subunit
MKTIKLILAITAFSIASSLSAQTNGSIKGTIVDEKGKAMPFVTVGLYQDSTLVTAASTDDNGEFRLIKITPGKYYIRTSFLGYNNSLLNGVIAHADQATYVDFKMTPTNVVLGITTVTAHYHESIVNKDFTSVTPITIDQIENAAVGKNDIIALITMVTPGVLATNDGKDIHVRGSRVGTTGYILDGSRTMGTPEVPGMGIAEMEVLTGGIPAEYGDFTGGIVIITTKEYQWEANRKKIKKEKEEDEDGE